MKVFSGVEANNDGHLTHCGRDKMAANCPDDIFKCIFLNETVWISLKMLLHFIPKGPINIIPALVQTMAWRRPGDKPLFEPMMISLLTHICVTRPQWVNLQKAYLHDGTFCIVETASWYRNVPQAFGNIASNRPNWFQFHHYTYI